MKKTIIYGSDAREKLLSGVIAISRAVKVTLGPSGRNVLIRRKGEREPFATKDGVTVAGEIFSSDYIEQIAIEAIQSVAINSDNDAGDGTSTATILAEAIFRLGSIFPSENTNYIDLKKGIDLGVAEVVSRLKVIARECKDHKELYNVAMISSNNDKEISSIVIDAYKVAGNQGVVNIKRSTTNETYLTTIEGMNLPTGYHSVYFVTDLGNDIVELDKPYVFITNEKINSVTDNLRSLFKIIAEKQESLLIICKDIDPSVLGMLVKAKADGALKVCVCKAPEFGNEQINLLHDLGVMLGKSPFLENEGLNFNDIEVRLDDEEYPVDPESFLNYFPKSEAALITRDRMSVKGPVNISDEEREIIEKNKVGRADKIREKITPQLNGYEKALLQSRISRLTDGIAYINIGAISDIEYNEKQHRIQDALYAVKSASEEGIVPGGGTALLFVSKEKLNHENISVQAGINVVLEAIKEPFKQILENVGIILEDDMIYKIQNEFNHGINARTGNYASDMMGQGIIDPVKVTRVALENAASVAGMLLTTDCVVIDNEVYSNNNKNNYE